MASGAPERPAVLRRLGIVKDEYDTTFVQTPVVRVERSNEGVESFGAETRSAEPRFPRALAFANRYPRVAVVVVAAVMLVGGVLTINALFGPAAPPVGASAEPAPLASSEAPVSAGEASSTSGTASESASAAGATRGASRAAPSSEGSPDDAAVASSESIPPPLHTLSDSDVASSVAQSPVDETTAVDTTTASPLAIVDDRIYSADDADVVPPRTSEGLLPGPTISAWTTRTNVMELIISQTGAVEHVSLLSAPQRMPDMLELSRAKVWKFTPAMKDGRPVRYRLRVTWEVNP